MTVSVMGALYEGHCPQWLPYFQEILHQVLGFKVDLPGVGPSSRAPSLKHLWPCGQGSTLALQQDCTPEPSLFPAVRRRYWRAWRWTSTCWASSSTSRSESHLSRPAGGITGAGLVPCLTLTLPILTCMSKDSFHVECPDCKVFSFWATHVEMIRADSLLCYPISFLALCS